MFKRNGNKLVLAILFLHLVSFTCSKTVRLNSIEFIFSYPVSFYKQNDSIKIYDVKDTIRIFYHPNYIIYKLSGISKFETDQKIIGTEPYFIFNKEDKFGFLFSSLKDSSLGTKFPIDSFLFNRGMKGQDFDLLPDSLWSLSVTKDNENDIIEKYSSKKMSDETSIDSAVCHLCVPHPG